jgi:hypothetical protein
VALALALVAQHPAGVDRDHLHFELSLFLDDDRRAADLALAGLAELGVVVVANGRRGDRYRVLPAARLAIATLTAPWLDALERKGGAPGAGEALGLRLKTAPAHVLAMLVSFMAAHPPRLRSAAIGTELHSRDHAKVLQALGHLAERSMIPHLLSLSVRAGLARPSGTRLSVASEAPAYLSAEPSTLWRRIMVVAVTPRAFPAVLRMLLEPEPGFVPEVTLRRASKVLHHTEQLAGGHPFPTDGRGSEAGARAEVESLRLSPLMEHGRTVEGAPALRLHPSIYQALRGTGADSAGRGKADGHVGADHEVHVGPWVHPHLAAMLGFFCEPVVLDTVSRFVISPASVAAGAARGIHPEQMEATLKELAARGVPDNVMRSLQDYGAPRGRAVFGRGLVVAFGSAEDAQKATSDDEMALMLGEALHPGVFLVEGSKEQKARARLMDLGLAVCEDTLAFVPPAAAPTDDDHESDAEAPLGTRVSAAREAALGRALLQAAASVNSVAPKTVPAAVLTALTGHALSAASVTGPSTSAVVPLRAKKAPDGGPVVRGDTPQALALQRALVEHYPVRLQYAPEAGGGTETMTVEVVEALDRAGTSMVRVRYPDNRKAQERVLRVARVQWVEPARKSG